MGETREKEGAARDWNFATEKKTVDFRMGKKEFF